MMDEIQDIIGTLHENEGTRELIAFNDYLKMVRSDPKHHMRGIFQLFGDMIADLVVSKRNEYQNDPESINYIDYDMSKLLIAGFNQPFFADRLFANRFVKAFESLKKSNQHNRIFLIPGPHGSGKSTFLNNLLQKFQEYINSEKGEQYEVVWRLNTKELNILAETEISPAVKALFDVLKTRKEFKGKDSLFSTASLGREFFEIQCPSHDFPLFIIPKNRRRELLERLIVDEKEKKAIFSEKQYQWIFDGEPCAICTSIYQSLLDRLGKPEKVFEMLFVRRYLFDRRLGEGISVFNPDDRVIKDESQEDTRLQRELNELLGQSSRVKYLYSAYARTNNGLYALMDVKGNNRKRFEGLHGISSEEIHKVGGIVEERVRSIFIVVANHEDLTVDDEDTFSMARNDRKNEISSQSSFKDRVTEIRMNYTLDFRTEVAIYRNLFGKKIEKRFLPRVLENFAKVIISSRLSMESNAISEWISDKSLYGKCCDPSFHLLKMAIYVGIIPDWLSENDKKTFTKEVRKNVIDESEEEGMSGFSGRDSLKIFTDFIDRYGSLDRLITMVDVHSFFNQKNGDISSKLPDHFLESLMGFYNLSLLEEVKEAIYYYNEKEIKRNIANYLFSISFDIGYKGVCPYTGDTVEVTRNYLRDVERKIFSGATMDKKKELRAQEQNRFVTETIQKVRLNGNNLHIFETEQFDELRKSYERNLKKTVLDPFVHNTNFRNAIMDFGTDKFSTYDRKIVFIIERLIKNLEARGYKKQEAKEICVYLIDNKLVQHFS